MKRYESIYIVRINLPEDELAGLIENFEKIIVKGKGWVISSSRWGQRKLAYDIKKQSAGYYVLVDYAGDSGLVSELERNFRIDDRILKYLTVKKRDKITREEIEKELAEKNAPAPEAKEEITSSGSGEGGQEPEGETPAAVSDKEQE